MDEALTPLVPEATVARLPIYLRGLVDLANDEVGTVSSEQLAATAGVNAENVRKDLSILGSYGKRGVGYEVDFLIEQIKRVLGAGVPIPVVIVGAGNLGRALTHYGGFAAGGFPVKGLVDSSPEAIGQEIAGITVEPFEKLSDVVKKNNCALGIIATPASAAQMVADQLVAAGIYSILNFAPGLVAVPEAVTLRKVDLATELHILAFHEQQRERNE
ncbi:MAG TPA: redox-sensing transcriptional repressor Rex [Acidimicrobiales bacterium]|nr:redox-sensing transcriptional repressor Rex [Acidimicrobiales bacterium]|tara:strand:- start:3831 stop:4478 length:648 start_codon:yes stop_codon:yes gene_type:complete